MWEVSPMMRHVFGLRVLCGVVLVLVHMVSTIAHAEAPAQREAVESHAITGVVQNQDLRRVGQAFVEIKDQEGNLVTRGVTNDIGEFTVTVPEEGTYSVHAILETYRSEYH